MALLSPSQNSSSLFKDPFAYVHSALVCALTIALNLPGSILSIILTANLDMIFGGRPYGTWYNIPVFILLPSIVAGALVGILAILIASAVFKRTDRAEVAIISSAGMLLFPFLSRHILKINSLNFACDLVIASELPGIIFGYWIFARNFSQRPFGLLPTAFILSGY